MRGERRANTGPKKGEVISKMPKVEFDMDAIKEIQRRKRGVCRRWSNKKRAI
jgi:hypothetical protein